MALSIRATAPLDGAALLPTPLIAERLRLDGSSDEATVEMLRDTALGWVERRSGVSLQRREWVATFGGFEDGLWLPRTPVASITAVTYLDWRGLECSAAGAWRLAGDRVVLAAGARWPRALYGGDVIVRFLAGHQELAADNPGLRVAALLLIQHLYDSGSLDDVPAAVIAMCDIDRVPVAG